MLTDLVSGEDLLSSIAMAPSHCVPHRVEWMRDLHGASFIRALIRVMKALLSQSDHLPKPSSPAIIPRVRFQQMNSGRTYKHSVHGTKDDIIFQHGEFLLGNIQIKN